MPALANLASPICKSWSNNPLYITYNHQPTQPSIWFFMLQTNFKVRREAHITSCANPARIHPREQVMQHNRTTQLVGENRFYHSQYTGNLEEEEPKLIE